MLREKSATCYPIVLYFRDHCIPCATSSWQAEGCQKRRLSQSRYLIPERTVSSMSQRSLGHSRSCTPTTHLRDVGEPTLSIELGSSLHYHLYPDAGRYDAVCLSFVGYLFHLTVAVMIQGRRWHFLISIVCFSLRFGQSSNVVELCVFCFHLLVVCLGIPNPRAITGEKKILVWREEFISLGQVTALTRGVSDAGNLDRAYHLFQCAVRSFRV